jgi:endonuclease G
MIRLREWICLIFVLACGFNVSAEPRARDRERFPPGLPVSLCNCRIIHHTGFTLCYDNDYKQARWVVYGLTTSETMGTAPRSNDFRIDPDVLSVCSALDDYRGSGFDRGHLAPAGDFKWSAQAMSETFFMSNMSPQQHGFNSGIWKNLEERVRGWAVENELVYVVSGPVFTDNMQCIGANKVAVPGHYYKVLLDYTEPELKATGFVLPNESSPLPLQTFLVTVDSVESLTGIDFYAELPDEQEEQLESHTDPVLWFNGATKATSYAHKKPDENDNSSRAKISANVCNKQCPQARRTGAQCKDGTKSSARGSGACSGHGGVKCWECEGDSE